MNRPSPLVARLEVGGRPVAPPAERRRMRVLGLMRCRLATECWSCKSQSPGPLPSWTGTVYSVRMTDAFGAY